MQKLTSIRCKLIVGGLATLLLPTILIGYFATLNSTASIIRLSKITQQRIAEGTAMHVEATLEGELKVAAAFATRTQIRAVAEAVSKKGLEKSSEERLQLRQDFQSRFEQLRSSYSAIFLATADGKIYESLAEEAGALDEVDFEAAPIFHESRMLKRARSSDIYTSKTSGEPVMLVSAPIFSDSGRFLGAVGGLLKASTITSLLTSSRVGDTGYCFMVNSDGVIVAHPEKKYVLTLDLKTLKGMEKITKALMSGQSSAEAYVFHGAEKIAGFAPIKQKSWSVAATQNANEFLVSVYTMREKIILIICGAVLFTMLIIFAAATSLTKPLNIVIEGLRSIASGRGRTSTSARIPVTSSDEIGVLSAEFNSLMGSINQLALFKKVIEGDDNIEDVYHRLGETFIKRIGIPYCWIYVVVPMKNTFQLVYISEGIHSLPNCHQHILNSCDMCKAKRLGHTLDSALFPEVCRYFPEGTEYTHYCRPIAVGSATTAVIQFIFEKTEDDAKTSADEAKIFKAEQYISESLAVIETKQLMSSLRNAALVDTQTGLHNRRYLQEYAEKIVAGARRRGLSVGLLLCDLDYFKQVNDTHGHSAGDTVLVETSKIIRESVRESDIIVRFGGEEFLVVLLDITEHTSLDVAEKIRDAIEKNKIKIPDGILTKTISIGVSEFPEDTETFWSCIKFADVALYKAKERGRNQCVRFTKEMWDGEQI